MARRHGLALWPFRRRPPGRHALGAAVTAIPSARPAPASAVTEPVAPVVPVAPAAPVVAAGPAAPVVAAGPAAPVVAVGPAAPVREPVAGPRVELGFRDGSTAALAPGSEQARALTDIASVLTRRD